MIYLDWGATSFHKPPEVRAAMQYAMQTCASPGRGGYPAAMEAARVVYDAREEAGKLFSCRPEQVVFTSSCTHGLNIAIRSLIRPGASVTVTGFEHNAVVRPLYALGAKVSVAGRRLFCPEDTLEEFARSIESADAAVFTQVSNVFGYMLPVEQMAVLCRERGVPFIVDAAQGAGTVPLNFEALGAEFVAMPGHKGLLGPQGTGVLLCRDSGEPLLYGGTGSASRAREMPPELPDRLEAGTMNVPGIAGLGAGMAWVRRAGPENLLRREQALIRRAAEGLQALGVQTFAGPYQAATLSFLPGEDCEEWAEKMGSRGFALRAGLHCAPLAHESAGTIETGTVRLSVGYDTDMRQIEAFLRMASKICRVWP